MRIATHASSRFRCLLLVAGLSLGLASGLSASAATGTADWDPTQARGKTRVIDFQVDEGTGMSVDISPDGRWLLFDLLAQVYRVPVAGGAAELLTGDSGVALNYHPRYSHDGRKIVFVSDRGGQPNLWLMDADGKSPRPLFLDTATQMAEPAWSADGRSVVAVRLYPHAQGGWTRTNRLWRFPTDGAPPVQLTGDDDHLVDNPSPSPDGRHLYYHRSSRPIIGEGFYKVGTAHQLRRIDLASGHDELVSETAGRRYYHQEPLSAFAPSVSPDGRWLAFARRVPGGAITHGGATYSQSTGLWLRDLHTGAERLLVPQLTPDQLETHTMYQIRLLPGYAWAHDGRSLVYSAAGGLRRVNVADGSVKEIPFTARVTRTLSEQVRPSFKLDDAPFTARFPRWPALSPDGKTLLFEAVGAIWRKSLPDGVPERLQPAQPADADGSLRFEYSPAWSPDGRWIAYTTWKEGEGGHVWKLPAQGGKPQQLTRASGEYLHPGWRADGRAILVTQGAGASFRGDAIGNNPWFSLVELPAAGGSTRELLRLPNNGVQIPRSFPGNDGRVYFAARLGDDDGIAAATSAGLRQAGMSTALFSVDGEGGDRRVHAGFPESIDIAPSPDGRWLAYQEGQQAYMVAMPAADAATPASLVIDKHAAGSQVRRLSIDGGLFPAWNRTGTVGYFAGARFFWGQAADDTLQQAAIGLRVEQPQAVRTLALINARILTMDARQVIARGTVLVRGRRIVAVGSDIALPADAEVVDLQGKVVMPGLIDVHAHHFGGGPFGGPDWGIIPQRRVESANYLAYGVTTTFDPATPAEDTFPVAELTEAGKLIGPRVLTTADPLVGTGDYSVGDPDSALHHADRLSNWGALGIKQYYQPRRDQRQWVTQAARARGNILVTGEGMDFPYNLAMIMDGQTAWEHPILDIPLYDDVVQFVARSGIVYNPELITPGQGRYILEHYLATSDLPHDPKQRNWVNWQWLARKQSYSLRPLSEYPVMLSAEAAKDIVRAGGKVGVGGHGQEQGLGTHWEIWTFGLSMTPQEALEAATIANARYLGLDRDLGSIEAGKIADLIVLKADPTADLRNSTKIDFVIKDGRMFDAMTLDQRWPEVVPYGPRRWTQSAAGAVVSP